ncbi:hypothetical protein ACFWUW_31660 [Streptomyces sp. NPDC058655]|uniref:hypothetical protein n=1 Tax=Streptomyces sp. NPDC058655 TaxID=3346577 RepID=UPI00365F2C6A
MRVLIETAGGPTDGAKRNDWIGYGAIRPRMVLLEKAGNPGAPDVDPLAPAPTNTPTPAPSAGQTAAPRLKLPLRKRACPGSG